MGNVESQPEIIEAYGRTKELAIQSFRYLILAKYNSHVHLDASRYWYVRGKDGKDHHLQATKITKDQQTFYRVYVRF